jgi:hypothetical protein
MLYLKENSSDNDAHEVVAVFSLMIGWFKL